MPNYAYCQMKKALLYSGLLIAFTIAGYMLSAFFFDTAFSQLIGQNIQIQIRNIGGAFQRRLFFALAIGAIPLLYFMVEKIAKLKLTKHQLYTITSILGFGIIFWQLKVFQVKMKIKLFSGFTLDDNIPMSMSIDEFNFERYLLLGFFIGALLSACVFRYINRTVTK